MKPDDEVVTLLEHGAAAIEEKNAEYIENANKLLKLVELGKIRIARFRLAINILKRSTEL